MLKILPTPATDRGVAHVATSFGRFRLESTRSNSDDQSGHDQAEDGGAEHAR